MPYNVGSKGSYGCSGYPVVDDSGKAVGCHPTRAQAVNHLQALYANVPDAKEKFDDTKQELGSFEPPIPSPLQNMEGIIECEYDNCGCETCMKLNVCCDACPVCQSEEMKSDCCEDISKKSPCWDGYVQRGMKPGKNGSMVPNCVPTEKADDLWEDDDTVVYETETVSKAEGYSPPAGARAAARKAIRFKEQGKAKGAGTSVGWTRAGQLARGETLSLSTVKRMYSYFSRHEVDKKGKDWGSQSNPSNGYIMWLAWGGDAGFAWSRRIVNAEKDKKMFADFFNPIEKQSKNVRGSGRGLW